MLSVAMRAHVAVALPLRSPATPEAVTLFPAARHSIGTTRSKTQRSLTVCSSIVLALVRRQPRQLARPQPSLAYAEGQVGVALDYKQVDVGRLIVLRHLDDFLFTTPDSVHEHHGYVRQ